MAISRSEVLRRAHSIWPMGGVPYSQVSTHHPDGYRADCSGFVSMCWGLATPGGSTVTLVTDGIMVEIAPDALKPGDAIGRCGPGTGGDNGHVQLFTGWYNLDPNDNHYYCLEQTGGRSGPHPGFYNWPAGYRAWRYVGIVDDTPHPAPPAAAPAYPLSFPPNVFGPAAGPNWQHGGFYANERPLVQALQRALIRKGAVPGVSNPGDGWADGIWEAPTTYAVRRFQAAHGLVVDGLVGPQDWAVLMAP